MSADLCLKVVALGLLVCVALCENQVVLGDATFACGLDSVSKIEVPTFFFSLFLELVNENTETVL